MGIKDISSPSWRKNIFGDFLILFVFCRKKNAVYRQKCTPIWPSKSKHSKSEAIFMFCVVIDLCKKLYLFRTVTFKHGIVNNKNIARSSESSGRIALFMILDASIVVKLIQLIWTIFMKRYTVSFAKSGVLHEPPVCNCFLTTQLYQSHWFHAIFMPVIIEFSRCIGTF